MRQKILHILPKLRRFAFALTGNEHDADDLLQSTIEKVLKKGVPDGVSIERWSFRVCKNTWIDETRHRKVRGFSDTESLHEQATLQDQEYHAIHRITLTQVNTAMEQLPDDQRNALAMVALAGLSYAEVADILEIPIGTVMSRVARARKTLAKKFSNPILEDPSTGGSNERH